MGGINNEEICTRWTKEKGVFLREAGERRENQGCYGLHMGRRCGGFPDKPCQVVPLLGAAGQVSVMLPGL